MNTKEIRIDTNKNGKKIAYEYDRFGMRWNRISITKAELLISACAVNSVTYGPDFGKYGVAIIGTESQGGMNIIYSSYVL